MAVIPLGNEDIQSKAETVARLQLENMYLVDSPFSPDNISRVSRPTLTTEATVGTGPIRGLYSDDGVFNSDWFVVSGSALYRRGSDGSLISLGNVPGSGYCQIVGDTLGAATQVFVLSDGVLYLYDGTSLTSVASPDGSLFGSMAILDGYVILTVTDDPNKTGQFYWIEPQSTTIDPLSFATAERFPDNLVSGSVIGDELWLIGVKSTEVWAPTGDKDAPFQRIGGRAYGYGCVDPQTTSILNVAGYPTLFWVTSTRVVVSAQGSPGKVSNEVVDEALHNSSSFKAFGFEYNRHSFYVIHCDDGTFVYDTEKGNWLRWSSFNQSDWKVKTLLQTGADVYAGGTDSTIYHLTDDVSDDDDPVIRVVSGLLPVSDTKTTCNRVDVFMNAGNSVSYDVSAVLELRWSDDLGNTYSDWVQTPVGAKGQYGTDVYYRSLGLMRRPGRVFQFRFSDKARFRLDYATVNEL